MDTRTTNLRQHGLWHVRRSHPPRPSPNLRESSVLRETFPATDLDANSTPRPDIMSDDEVIHVRGSVVWTTSRIQNLSITLRAFFFDSVGKNPGGSRPWNHLLWGSSTVRFLYSDEGRELQNDEMRTGKTATGRSLLRLGCC